MATTKQQQLLAPKDVQLVEVPYPHPAPHEVTIRVKAVALNPLDWKNRATGALIQQYPAVLGGDAAGIVEEVGAAVTHVKPGDEVFSLAGATPRAGAFQDVIAVPGFFAARKPTSLSFEEAATIPVCFMSAFNTVTVGLKVQLPFLPIPDIPTATYKSILVLGGSGLVGANAIQMLRIALPDVKIYYTSSEKHYARINSLGGNTGFDRSATPTEIKAATADGAGVDAILDAVGTVVGGEYILDALNPNGPKVFAFVSTGPPPKVPEGINKTMIFGRKIFEHEAAKGMFPAVAKLIDEGKWKLPSAVENVGSGYEGITKGLDDMAAGKVSGTKLTVKM